MLQLGRDFFWVLLLGFVVLVWVTFEHLPPVVASHFDITGAPNGWSSRPTYAILLIAIGVLLPLSTIALVTVLTRRGPRLLNIPARDYWNRPEHQQEAMRRVRALMWWLGCIMTGTALAIHWLVLEANGYQPPRLSTRGISSILGAVLLAFVLWIVGWYRMLRPPTAD